MLKRIKSIFAKEKGLPRAQVAALARLAPDERLTALAVTLHDLSVQSARRFVEEEHGRADSPFRTLAKADLFHELLVMNFWVFESLFGTKRPELLERVYRHYGTTFVWGWESGQKELLESMRAKFRTYDRSWDEHSGHQDVFARQAVGIIFGHQEPPGAPQAAFWIITHADRTMKEFARVRESVEGLLGDAAASG